MRIGDLLLQARLVSAKDLAAALEVQATRGGRLGDLLVAAGCISQETLDSFLNRMPAEPHDIEATRLDPTDLLGLLLKLIYVEHRESLRQFIAAIQAALSLDPDVFDLIVHKITVEKELELAAYQPRFLVDQIVASCRFMRQPPHFEPRFIDYAWNNLKVRRIAPAKPTSATVR